MMAGLCVFPTQPRMVYEEGPSVKEQAGLRGVFFIDGGNLQEAGSLWLLPSLAEGLSCLRK